MPPRSFKTPLVPLVPLLGVAVCFFMMAFLPLDTWIRLIVWMVIGFDVYLWYGIRHSALQSEGGHGLTGDYRIISWSGILLSALLAVLAVIHHIDTKGTDTGLYYFSLVFSIVHLILYLRQMFKK